MVNCWFVLILVIYPIADAWKPSAEDQRDPIDYHRNTQDHKALRQDHQDLTPRASKQDSKYLKDQIDYKDPTEYRKGPKEYRRKPRELGRRYHAKRHMLPEHGINTTKKRSTTLKPIREIRKKPSGHLTPLEDDDMENDEVVSVAIGPPPLRGKFEKTRKKHISKPIPNITPTPSAIDLVKDLFTQITKEFLTRDVDENFVFGQYLGNAMKNLTSDLRLSMQHEVLELIVKYQKANRGDARQETETAPPMLQILKDVKVEKKFISSNDTEEPWPDFSNLAKIVG